MGEAEYKARRILRELLVFIHPWRPRTLGFDVTEGGSGSGSGSGRVDALISRK